MPLKPEESVEWILRSYQNLKSYKHEIKVVPVSIIYDRLFDAKLLSTELVSGEFQDVSFPELMYQIWKKPHNQMGNIYVKYCEPIDLYKFEDENKGLNFTQ